MRYSCQSLMEPRVILVTVEWNYALFLSEFNGTTRYSCQNLMELRAILVRV